MPFFKEFPIAIAIEAFLYSTLFSHRLKLGRDPTHSMTINYLWFSFVQLVDVDERSNPDSHFRLILLFFPTSYFHPILPIHHLE